MEKEIYPLKFIPIIKESIWGGSKLKSRLNKPFQSNRVGESWELSCVSGNVSVVANGFLKGNNLEELIEIYMGDLLGESVYEKYGLNFPLLFKFIDANDVLSIQVHPNDTLAMERHQSFGKTEMWYIIEHEPDSELICGFNKSVDKDVYMKHLNEKKLTRIMNFEKVQQGDVYYIPAGRVHAVGSGILLAEIQQCSDVTYRIFDWNRVDDLGKPRELHTELALDAIDYSFKENYKSTYPDVVDKTVNIVECDYFTTNILKFEHEVVKDYNLIDSFVVYMCTDGSFEICSEKGILDTVTKGETVMIPAILKNLRLVPKKYSELLEIYIK